MIGKQLSHLRITAKLGEGGMGEVYRAEDSRLKRDVAVKVLPSEMAATPERLERFQREAEAVAAINHPNIVTIHSVEHAVIDTGETVHFIVMELVEGSTLDRLLTQEGMELDRLFDVAVPLADALTAAHERGITHRDLKPANVMVSREGRIKVLDFGLAKAQQAAAGGVDSSELPTQALTQEGLVVGTLPYMSPEQAEGREVDHRSDIFSFGVMLYEMAAGRRPFSGDTAVSLVSSIIKDAPPPVTELKPSLPRHLGRVIGRCLEKNPADRYQSARDLFNELRNLRQEVVSGESQIAAAPAVKKPPWIGIGVVVVVLALAAGWALLDRGGGGAAGEVAAGDEAEQRIAVLPFENLGPSEDEYFAAGMTEEITSRLSAVRGLGVISRKSAMTYAGSDKTYVEIGSELGVDYLVGGTVRWARGGDGAGRVRITPQLVRVSDDTQVWSDVYDRVIDDIFDVQSEIASVVIDELGIQLLEPERGALAEAPTDSVEAFTAYMKGLEYSVQWEESNLSQAVAMFGRAVELDPDFALAWGRLGRAHASIVHFGWDRSQERMDDALAAVERALELAPESYASHLALGMYHYHAHKEYDLADAAFAEADRLRPDQPDVLSSWALVQRRRGQWEESTRNMERAARLSPRDENILVSLIANYLYTRRYAEASEATKLCLEVRPDALWCKHYGWETHISSGGTVAGGRALVDALPESSADVFVNLRYLQALLERDYGRALEALEPADDRMEYGAVYYPTDLFRALVHSLNGDEKRARELFERTRRELEQALERDPAQFELRPALGLAYAGLGLKAEAIREGRRAVEEYPVSFDAVWAPESVKDLAKIYTMVGDHDAAFEQLDRLLSIANNFSVRLLELEPWWDPLRGHPEYRELIARHAR